MRDHRPITRVDRLETKLLQLQAAAAKLGCRVLPGTVGHVRVVDDHARLLGTVEIIQGIKPSNVRFRHADRNYRNAMKLMQRLVSDSPHRV